MDYELFKSIVEEASHYGPRSFSLHLFGEPLLYPHILDAIAFIKAKNKRHTVLLTTNGVLLNRYVEDLLKVRVDKIIWSWRKNNFTERTKEVLKEKGKIRFLIEETPEGEIEKWKDAKDVEIKHLHSYGGSIDVSKWKVPKPPKRHACYHLWLAPAVRWNGEIVECCNLSKSGEDVLGRYGETNISEVWNGEDIRKLRESHMKGIYPGKCGACTSWQAYPDIFFKSQKHG